MKPDNTILNKVKNLIRASFPDSTIILYGSQAREDARQDSDYDLLVLLNKDEISREDEIAIKYPLYDIEFDTGNIISPIVLSKKKWESQHFITPFYQNVKKEGIVL